MDRIQIKGVVIGTDRDYPLFKGGFGEEIPLVNIYCLEVLLNLGFFLQAGLLGFLTEVLKQTDVNLTVYLFVPTLRTSPVSDKLFIRLNPTCR